jgi:hypothetical protein
MFANGLYFRRWDYRRDYKARIDQSEQSASRVPMSARPTSGRKRSHRIETNLVKCTRRWWFLDGFKVGCFHLPGTRGRLSTNVTILHVISRGNRDAPNAPGICQSFGREIVKRQYPIYRRSSGRSLGRGPKFAGEVAIEHAAEEILRYAEKSANLIVMSTRPIEWR